jgi:ssDNA-binding replication factor A large subunit
MKRVYYASGSVLTGDRTAEAIVHYAAALATRTTSDSIDIPILLPDGATGRAQLLIGPASQLVVVPEEGAAAGPEDDEIIVELSRRTRLLSSPHPQAVDDAATPYYADGENYTDATDDSEG